MSLCNLVLIHIWYMWSFRKISLTAFQKSDFAFLSIRPCVKKSLSLNMGKYKSCKIWTNDSSHLKIGDVLDIDICFIYAEKEKKLSDSFLVIYQNPSKWPPNQDERFNQYENRCVRRYWPIDCLCEIRKKVIGQILRSGC